VQYRVPGMTQSGRLTVSPASNRSYGNFGSCATFRCSVGDRYIATGGALGGVIMYCHCVFVLIAAGVYAL